MTTTGPSQTADGGTRTSDAGGSGVGEGLVEVLNLILEVERAGAKALTALLAEPELEQAHHLLGTVQRDQARCCGLLTRIVVQLGGRPSDATASFHDDILGLQALADRLALLNSGQAWVVHQLDEVLPHLASEDMAAPLAEMREAHRLNYEACTHLLTMIGAA